MYLPWKNICSGLLLIFSSWFFIWFCVIQAVYILCMLTLCQSYSQVSINRWMDLRYTHTYIHIHISIGFTGSSGKESPCQCRRYSGHVFDHGVRKIPWSRKCQPNTVFLPGKSTGARWATVHGKELELAKSWKQLRNWVNSTHTHTCTQLSHKKEWNSAIWSNIDGPREYHA